MNLPLLVAARVCTTAIFMTYPACLDGLMDAWGMSATRAGTVQGAFTIAFALSLLGASFLCDRFGSRRVFAWASVASALAALVFAVFTRSYETALVTVALVGVTQGGTYTPAIMLVAANAAPARKNAAIGWVLAGMSAGYVISIFASSSLLAVAGYETAFLAVAAITVLGGLLAIVAVRGARDTLPASQSGSAPFSPAMRRRSRLLTVGYIGHTWELLGMWAWVPAFLAAALTAREDVSAVEIGLWTALALHLSGFVSSFLSGYAADRFGVRPVLIGFAALGFVCSAGVGWLDGAPVALLLALVAVYGFATIGDSAVLSSAMTDAVPPQHLGKILGLRSVLGIGAGALAPIAFGLALDIAPDGLGWGIAFGALAIGGLLALVCAAMLGERESMR